MFRHRRSPILLGIQARSLSEVGAEDFVDGKSEGIFKDSECDCQLVGWHSYQIGFIAEVCAEKYECASDPERRTRNQPMRFSGSAERLYPIIRR
jgi:hypothetical protein